MCAISFSLQTRSTGQRKINYFLRKNRQLIEAEKIERKKELEDEMEKYEAKLYTFETDCRSLSRNGSLNPEHVANLLKKMSDLDRRAEELTTAGEFINDIETILFPKGSHQLP